MAEDGMRWAEINDRLAVLDGECRHYWSDYHGQQVVSEWMCGKCMSQCCHHLIPYLDNPNECCGLSDFDLPAVGDGFHDYTLEQMLELAKRLDLYVGLSNSYWPSHGCRWIGVAGPAGRSQQRSQYMHPNPRIALGTAIIRAMEGE